MKSIFCNCLRHHPSRRICIHDIESFLYGPWQDDLLRDFFFFLADNWICGIISLSLKLNDFNGWCLFLYFNHSKAWLCAKCPPKARDAKVLVPSLWCCWEMVALAGATGRKLHHGDMAFIREREPLLIPLFSLHEMNCLTVPWASAAMYHLATGPTATQPTTQTLKSPDRENSKCSLCRRWWSRVSPVQTKLAP